MRKKDDLSAGLIFRWRTAERAGWRLLFWALVAGFVLTVWVLLFEVVYPTPSRRSHTMQRITLLDPSSPKAREVIATVADRSFLLLAPNATAAPKLEDLRPVFTPGFKDFQLHVKDLPDTGTPPPTLPRLFGADQAPLPALPVASTQARPAAPARSFRLVAVPVGGLEKRAVLHDIDPLPSDSPAVGQTDARMRVAVAADGRLLTMVSLMDESAIDSAAMAREFCTALRSLRFAPVAKAGPQWGVIAFKWKEAPP